jgi:hypothetical protein
MLPGVFGDHLGVASVEENVLDAISSPDNIIQMGHYLAVQGGLKLWPPW